MIKNGNEKNDRMTYIDVAKGILIICVVIGHVINFEYFVTAAIKTIIYTFHMPAFFIISGILVKPENLRKQSFGNFLKQRTKRLLIPYVLFELIGGIIQMFLFGCDKVNFVGILYGIVTLHCHTGADWFLPTLFFAELLFWLCVKKSGQKLTFFIAALSFAAAFIVQDANYFVAIVRRILVALSFKAIGFNFRKTFIKKSAVGIVISAVLVVCISYYNGVVDLSMRMFNNPVLYVAGGIVGAYFVLDLSQYLFGCIEKILAAAGRNSLLIMGTHQHIMVLTNVICGSVYPIEIQLLLIPIITLYELIIIAVCCLFSGRFQKQR